MSGLTTKINWLLDGLSLAELEEFECGIIEVFGEDEHGREGSLEIEVKEIAILALDRIRSLEHALTQIMDLANRDSDSFGLKRTDIAARAKEALVIHESEGV